ncbi:carboxypeptidase-like regulatory domain-containing protein [Aquimarina sp. U1-2]|uniref:carboxypeptidase-like regulatory domain-containing protein n=1 Tax=Aquimarina sp. U1-2 TaxID=2823141 RepID=UPI001AECA589|nr:carboxypeptidase-like regulatory domain-containing protein [Aquimarina sp. U1-2]MBP2832855.1 carboxypeptidase-like regulatory domain-containing protein [Aquimarina sp. U1-2]
MLQIRLNAALFFFFLSVSGQNEKAQVITGQVFYEDVPLSSVAIGLKNAKKSTSTNNKGFFTITVKNKDTLVLSHIGFRTKEYVIKNLNTALTIKMYPLLAELDEVDISFKKHSLVHNSQSRKPKEINSVFGNEILRKKGQHIDYVSGSTLNLAAPETVGRPAIVNALQGRVANYRIAPDGNGVILRSNNSINLTNNALWDVNGTLYEGFPPPIDLTTIEDVFVIKGLAGALRYGTLGSGGVIVIKTTTNLAPSKSSRTTKINTNTSYYKNDALPITELTKQQLGILPVEKKQFANYANSLGHDIASLKSLAYQYQKIGYDSLALPIYRKIIALLPTNDQAYRDLAQAYLDNNKPFDSWKTYMSLLEMNEENFPEGIGNLVFHEMERLYVTENFQNKVHTKFTPENKFGNSENASTRIVFEWSDRNKNICIEIVNPHNQVYNQCFGPKYSGCKQAAVAYYLDHTLTGEWQFNCQPHMLSREEQYLKITVFPNWNSLQKIDKQIKVYRFEDMHTQKYQVLRLKN